MIHLPMARMPLIATALWAISATGSAGPFAPTPNSFPYDPLPVAMTDPGLVAWATGWIDYQPGAELLPQWQNADKALGPAVGDITDVVSLGRGGRITLTFDAPITNGESWDFAVFENSFDGQFLELAFVEVSSDGTNFFRFPTISLTPGPVNGFGTVDASEIRGLAGKYELGQGTAYDLQELSGTPGLDIARITHVRIVDIVGDGSVLDSRNNPSLPIYDAYPTFQSAGFDLEALGVFHQIDAATTQQIPIPPAYLIAIAGGFALIRLFLTQKA